MPSHRWKPCHPILIQPPTLPLSLSMRSGKQRCTPLHYAAGAGDIDLCKRLIEKGAKVNTWDSYQYTAVDYAKQSGATDCVAYLEEVSTPGATTAGKAAANVFFLEPMPLPEKSTCCFTPLIIYHLVRSLWHCCPWCFRTQRRK